MRRYIIIDGQQRITTIFLLLKALHDASDSESLKEEIRKFIFNENKYEELSPEDQNKIRLADSENDQFTDLMQGKPASTKKSSKIRENYNYLRTCIKNSGLSCEDILSGVEKLTAAVIVLDPKEDNPQVVFESINSTGLELSLADLIRNFILMSDLMTANDQRGLFKDYWLKIEGNIKNADMPDFITHYLQFACREDITAKNAYSQFKALFAAKNYTNEVMLKELLRYSGYYKAFLYGSCAYSEAVNRRLADIRSMDQSTIYPFLFYVFDDYREGAISEETLEKVLSFFVSYLLRLRICRVDSKSMRNLFKNLYENSFKSGENEKGYSDEDYYDAILEYLWNRDIQLGIPKDEEFRNALLTRDLYNAKNTNDNWVCRFILEAIENNGKEKVNIRGNKDISIEHIMPQNLNNDWKKELGLGEKYEQEQQVKDVQSEWLHKLGNLSLTAYNPELSDKPFAEKKELIKSRNSHMVELYKDVLAAPHWNEDAIRARGKALSELLVDNIFKIDKPKGGIDLAKEIERKTVVRIGEDFDATNTKPTSYNFMDEGEQPVSSNRDLISKLMQRLYEYDSETIEYLAEQNFKYLAKDEHHWKDDVKQINDTGIYFESHGGASQILSFIRAVMDQCQIELDELVINLAR